MRIHSSYQPHEQRVLDERDDLLDKLRKLRAFILDGRGRFGGLPHAERDRLKHQEEVMSEYAAILAERIEAFPNPTKDKPVTHHQSTEQAIIDAGANTAPRVTPDDMEANIVATEIVKHVSVSGQVLRWAVLTTKSGYSVAGEPSCAVSNTNDNQAIGEKIAIENAKQTLWPLMGYALKEQLAAVK